MNDYKNVIADFSGCLNAFDHKGQDDLGPFSRGGARGEAGTEIPSRLFVTSAGKWVMGKRQAGGWEAGIWSLSRRGKRDFGAIW